MFNFRKIIRYFTACLVLLSNFVVMAFKPIPQSIDDPLFHEFYNEFTDDLSKKAKRIDVEGLLACYIKTCPCSKDSEEQISLIIDALEKKKISPHLFVSLLFYEQTYKRIVELGNDNLRIREFIEFMKKEKRRFNEWQIELLSNSRLPKLVIDEKNHDIIFKVPLKDWGDNIYLSLSLKPTVYDTYVSDEYYHISKT